MATDNGQRRSAYSFACEQTGESWPFDDRRIRWRRPGGRRLPFNGLRPGGGGVLAPSVLTNGFQEDGESFTTASVTVGTDRLVLVCVLDSFALGICPRSVVSGLGLTWTQIATVTYSGGVRRVGAWWAVNTGAPTTGAVTLTLNNEGDGITSTGTGWVVTEVAGADLAAPIVQSALADNTNTNVSTLDITLAAAAKTSNRAFSWWGHRVVEATTPRAGWTELVDFTGASPSTGMEFQWRHDAFETTASASWPTSDKSCGVAFEVAAEPVVLPGVFGARLR